MSSRPSANHDRAANGDEPAGGAVGDRAPAGGASANAIPADSGAAQQPRSRRKRLLGLLLLVAIAVPAVLAAMVWWGERPLRLANSALKAGDPQQALALVDGYLAEQPTHPQALAIRARAIVALRRNPDEAIRLFESVGAATIDDMHALAQAYLLKEQYSRALPLLKNVVQRSPGDSDALHELAATQVRLGLFDQALVTAEQYAQLPGNAPRGYLLLGTIHGDLGMYPAAAQSFARVLKDSPHGENLQVSPDEFFRQYGDTLLRAGEPRAARGALERSLAMRPSAAGYFSLGNAHAQLGETQDAISAWKRALDFETGHVGAREALANAALQAGRGNEAVAWLAPLADRTDLAASTAYLLERAHTLEKNEEQVAIWRERARSLRASQSHAAAIENILRESPGSYWARVVLTHRFASAGNWEQAELLAEQLAAEGAGHEFVQRLIAAVRRRGGLPPVAEFPLKQM